MFDNLKQIWKGGTKPDSFPHICPYRVDGADRQGCIELSGSSYQRNIGGCCGAQRGPVLFSPCNSEVRSCVECLRSGRRGEKTNRVRDPSSGLCEEHLMQARGEVAEQIVISPPAKEPAKGDKLQVLEEVAAELRSGRPRIFMNELIKFAARRLEMSESGLRTYVYRTTAKAQRDKWLFGENPKITRAKMKFDELLRLRETMRDKGGPKPYKRQFAKMAAEHLGMKQSSAEVYIYEKLTKEQAKLLDFGTAGNTPRFTSVEKIEILKEERKRFTEENGYRPLKSELAKFSADKLGLKVSSARTFINYLDESVVRELDFANSKLVIFERKNSEDVRAVLLGAVAILRFNGEKVTISGLSQVLNCSRLAIETYAQKHPDVWAIIER